MKKKKLFVWIAAVLALAAGAALVWLRTYATGCVTDGPGTFEEAEIRRAEYGRSGGMAGDMYRIVLEGEKMTVEKREAAGRPEKKKTYAVSAALYAELRDIARKSGMRDWTDPVKSGLFAADAPAARLAVTFGDGLCITAGTDDILPEGGAEAVNAFLSALEKEMK